MKVADIAEIIERFAPKETAESYDNVGLMLGDLYQEATGVLVCLDITSGAVREAAAAECNLIITHHPAIFKPLRNLDLNGARARIFREAFARGVTVYSAHTNVDAAKNGISYETARRAGLTDIREFAPFGGVICGFDGTLKDLAESVAVKLGDKTVIYAGDPGKPVKTVVLCGGAGGGDGELAAAAFARADAFISAEFKHSLFTDAVELGKGAVQFSHYAGEICFLDIVYDLLKPELRGLKIVKYDPGAPAGHRAE